MKLDLEETKSWLKLDEGPHEDDPNIMMLMRAAEIYLYKATGRKRFGEETELAKLMCFTLITHWYEDRDFYSPSPQAVKKPIITAMMTQLQLGGDEYECENPKRGRQPGTFEQKSGTLNTRIRR